MKTSALKMIGGRAFSSFLALALAAAFVPLAGAQSPSLPDIVKKNLDRKFVTEADAVILYEKRTVTLGKDGKVTERVRRIQKMLTDFALDDYCDPRLRFNAAYQKLSVIEATTVMKDGKKVETKGNGKNLSTPEGLEKFPRFADIQEMVVTHVGVEVGAVTVLEYEIEDQKPSGSFFYGNELFADDRDIEEKILEIRVPAGKELLWKSYNFQPEASRTSDGGQDVYAFRVTGRPGVNLREIKTDAAMVLPALLYSERISGAAFAGAVMGGAYDFGSSLSKENEAGAMGIIRAIDGELEDKPASPLDRTLYIHRRIADWLADAGVDRRIFGWKSRAPGEAFASGYADMFEKLGILTSVFQAIGYAPVPIVTLHRTGDEMMLHPDNIAGAWVRISAHGFYLYLPARGSSLCGEPRPEKAFVVTKDGVQPADFVRPLTTRSRIDLSLDLRKEPRTFSAMLKMRGSANPYWRVFVSGGKVGASEIAGEVLGKLPLMIQKVYFQRLALDESVVVASGSVNAADGEADVSMPSPMMSGSLGLAELQRQSRETPLLWKEKEVEILHLTALLPEKGEVLYMPAYPKGGLTVSFDPAPGSAGEGKMEVFWNASVKDGKLKLGRKVTITPGLVRPGQYGKFRDALGDVFSPSGTRAVIKLPQP
jgi:hypothetical protein